MILFTADWHIKLGQKNVPVEWATARYHSFFEQVREAEKGCEMHIIGGDLFDRLPSIEELQLYFEFVASASVPTIIYPGNHEATKKNKSFFGYLKDVTQSLNKLVEIVDEPYENEFYKFSILPYNHLHRSGSIESYNANWPLFTHVRGEIPPHVKPEVDLDRFSSFPIVFAGDLHSHSNTQRNIIYPGSPMTTSFHRTEVETGYLVIDEGTWDWEWKAFELPQLIRKTVTSQEEMVKTSYHHTIYEIEGDLQDLAAIENSELLDKKLIKRNRETALILDKEFSLEEELAEYLRYILELSDDKVAKILRVFHDYTKTTPL